MFKFIDKIILSIVLERIEEIKPMQPDIFEKPSIYKGWPFFLRYWLAMRYLKRKTETLGYFRLKNQFPIPEKDFVEQFKSLLLVKKKNNNSVPRWTSVLRSIVIYPLLFCCLITIVFLVKKDYNRELLEKALSVHLIQYADLLHQRIRPKLLNQKAWLAKIDSQLSIEKEQILSALPYPLLLPFEQALLMLKDDNKTGEDIFAAFTVINKNFDKYALPYYIVPKTFSANCFSFIGLSLESELPDANKNCQTTMLITYKIKQRDYFEYKVAVFPVFHGYRIDNIPISEAALGLTYHKGLGSLVLLNSTRDYALNQILPALIYSGRHQIVPLWFKNDPRIENEVAKVYQKTLESIYQGEQLDIAKSLAKALVNNQEAATRSRLRQSLMQVDRGMGGDFIHSGLDALTQALDDKDNTPEFLGIEVLENLIIKSVAYHEAYHQIPKGDWIEADWVGKIFKNQVLKDDILEELGAYLVELYYGEKTRALQITQLFFFSVNILLENRPESAASRLILATLRSKQQIPSITNNPFELLKAYKALNKMPDEELGQLAEKAYLKLFERPLPQISH
jgi:hypothetical protein